VRQHIFLKSASIAALPLSPSSKTAMNAVLNDGGAMSSLRTLSAGGDLHVEDLKHGTKKDASSKFR